jgi:type I site-specific restriction-modification system R (restriction) subunit
MEQLTDNSIASQEEILTPQHSIPRNIHCSNVSGSGGRFNSFNDKVITHSISPFEKTIKKADNISIQRKFNELYDDAAKRTAVRQKLADYAIDKKIKEELSFRQDKKISRTESVELFERLNKDSEIRNERIKISKKVREDQELKVLKNPAINKSSINLQQDVVTRLLSYGECIKRKNEERVRMKKEREEEELKNMPSVHKRGTSESDSFSGISTPGKDLSYRTSPSKNTPYSNKSNFSSQEQNSLSAKNPGFCGRSTPDKIIKKVQNMSKIPPFRPYNKERINIPLK